MRPILEWQIATVKSIHPETSKTKTFTLSLPNWVRHKPGQHYDVRLTAPDGYRAQRSYSIASEPERMGEIDLTVERVEDGEVSSIRHRIAAGSTTPVQLLYSSRTPEDVIYSKELMRLQNSQSGLGIFFTFTHQSPPGWIGFARRIDVPMLREVSGPLQNNVQAYVCGPTLMVEAVANGLIQIGLGSNQIRTERFGPTGSNG